MNVRPYSQVGDIRISYTYAGRTDEGREDTVSRQSKFHSRTPMPAYSHVAGVCSGQTEPRASPDSVHYQRRISRPISVPGGTEHGCELKIYCMTVGK